MNFSAELQRAQLQMTFSNVKSLAPCISWPQLKQRLPFDVISCSSASCQRDIKPSVRKRVGSEVGRLTCLGPDWSISLTAACCTIIAGPSRMKQPFYPATGTLGWIWNWVQIDNREFFLLSLHSEEQFLVPVSTFIFLWVQQACPIFSIIWFILELHDEFLNYFYWISVVGSVLVLPTFRPLETDKG